MTGAQTMHVANDGCDGQWMDSSRRKRPWWNIIIIKCVALCAGAAATAVVVAKTMAMATVDVDVVIVIVTALSPLRTTFDHVCCRRYYIPCRSPLLWLQ